MKRVLVAGVLGSLLLLGAPTLASSAPRSDTKAEKGHGGKDGGNKAGDHKGGDHKGGDHKGGDKARDGKGHRDGKGDHDGRHDRHGRSRHGHRHGGYYGDHYRGGYGYGGYYGEPYDCYYGPNGAYNCEEYGGDWDPYGANYRGRYREGYVVVRQNAFSPQQANARPGQPVVWQFADGDVPHTVTADNGSFDSGKKVNDEFQLRFDHPGSYSYHCAIHPEMRGRVVVHG